MKTLPVIYSSLIVALFPITAWAQGQSMPEVGMHTAIQGKVVVNHPGAPDIIPVKVNDYVLFQDIIETQQESKTKVLFQDNSTLTIGPESRLEVTEAVYEPSKNKRSTIVRLFKGKVRAFLSTVFTGIDSRFEIHTPTAVAAARGTQFLVWLDNTGTTWIKNITPESSHGIVTVTYGNGNYHYSLSKKGDLLKIDKYGRIENGMIDGQIIY